MLAGEKRHGRKVVGAHSNLISDARERAERAYLPLLTFCLPLVTFSD